MLELSATAYAWMKALHIIFAIAWLAGLFYLPRLYVYHTQVAAGSEASETFKVMERKLLGMIMHPAMVATLLFGGVMMLEMGADAWSEGWLLLKLACMAGLVAVHVLLARWQGDFAEDRNVHSERFYRIVNEAPTVLMIAIVILAVFRPA